MASGEGRLITYEIISGRLFAAGALIGLGYSGDPDHKNDPGATGLQDEGPIPEGIYQIGPPVDTVTHGPFVLPLSPDYRNEMYGRTGFLMHGDSVVDPGSASKGCIIMPRSVREIVWASGDRILEVVERISTQ